MRVFLQALYGQIFLNLYIFWRGRQALPPQKRWRMPFYLFFAIELLLYFFGFFFHKDLPENILMPILAICGTWYIASIYLTIGLLVLDFIRLTNKIKPWYPAFVIKHWRNLKLSLYLVFIIGITFLMINGYHNVSYPVVKHLEIHIPKTVKGRDSLTIAMMSDMHFGEFIRKENAQRMVALCNAQHPDLVLIDGDIIDYESIIAMREHIEEDLKQLKAPLGIYITLGNHEYRANRNIKIKWLRDSGATLLIDSVAMPDNTFYLVGRDDGINKDRKSLHTLLKGVDMTKPIIVADHQPFCEEIAMNQADLGLHGHTHNGQFWPYSYIIKSFYEYSYGYYKKGKSQFYVSSGIGCAGPPYRIGTQSELVMIHITFDKEK